MRREPAHQAQESSGRASQILSAYDAVEQCISSHGLADAGSPREVYFTDFDPAEPADEVCDVAYPGRASLRSPSRRGR